MILFLIISLIFTGYLYFNLFNKDYSFFDKLGLGYITSLGLITFIYFLLNENFDVKFTLQNSFYIIFSTIFLIILLTKIFKIKIFENKFNFNYKFIFSNKVANIENISKFCLMLICILAFVSSIYWPTKDWDSIVLYDFRAKSFAITGDVEDAMSRGYFFGYPLLTSIAQAMVYLTGFRYVGIIHSLFYISFVFIIYSYFRDDLNTKKSLFFTLIMATFPSLYNHAQMTYTNLAYMVYYISGIILITKWIKYQKLHFLFNAGILIGLSTWTRSTEPFWLTLQILVIVSTLFYKKWFAWILYTTNVLAIRFPWIWFEEMHLGYNRSHLTNSGSYLQMLFSSQALHNLIPVTLYFYNNVIKENIYAYLILGISCFLVIKNKIIIKNFSLTFIILITLMNLALIYVGIFIFSLTYEDWINIGGSAQRMAMFIPVLIVMSSLKLTNLEELESRKK